MAKLKIGGQVLYDDMRTPVKNARVRIYDLDTGGNGNDKIFDKVTNQAGKFSGRSKEWIDPNTVDTPFGTAPTPDLPIFRFRVTENGRRHWGPFVHMGDNVSAPIVVPWMPIEKPQRELVHLITLSDQTPASEKPLYEVIEFAAAATSSGLLVSHYKGIDLLERQQATLTRLRRKLESVASQSSVRAVDLIMSPHGLENQVVFYPDESVSMTDVAEELKKIPADRRRKFRMLFSTACWGATHIQAWLDIGFKVASGSEGIYADAALSFPAFLTTWITGGTFKEAVDSANACDPMHIQDNLAKLKFEAQGSTNLANQVNSYRRYAGELGLTISSTP